MQYGGFVLHQLGKAGITFLRVTFLYGSGLELVKKKLVGRNEAVTTIFLKVIVVRGGETQLHSYQQIPVCSPLNQSVFFSFRQLGLLTKGKPKPITRHLASNSPSWAYRASRVLCKL